MAKLFYLILNEYVSSRRRIILLQIFFFFNFSYKKKSVKLLVGQLRTGEFTCKLSVHPSRDHSVSPLPFCSFMHPPLLSVPFTPIFQYNLPSSDFSTCQVHFIARFFHSSFFYIYNSFICTVYDSLFLSNCHSYFCQKLVLISFL